MHVLPDKMKAVEITAPGGPDVLALREMPRPAARANEVLIRVEAAGVNRPDILQRQGLYRVPKDASPLPGLEVAGTIAEMGAEVLGFSLGERVLALTNGGGYAQYVRVPAGQVLPIPSGLDMVEAASLPETLFTVWQVLCMRARLTEGQTVLIHGGASGIGGMALQVAKWIGAETFVTVSTEEKAQYARSMGADYVIIHKEEDFEARAKDLTAGHGIDVIVDIVGGDYLPRNIRTLANGGKLIQLALLGGTDADLQLGQVLTKQLSIFGSLLRPQPPEVKALIAHQLVTNIWKPIELSEFKLPRLQCFPLQQAADAHRLMEQPDHFGKIVLTVTHDDPPTK